MCSSSGKKITYIDLQTLNISPNEVLRWSSSVEKADEYAAYLFNSSLFYDAENIFLCNCSNPSVFGKFCEYELFFNSQSFHNTIIKQFEMKYEDIYSSQIYGNILCYTTLICDYGLLCLDWRNICDGAQNCINGKDEENCDLLEFNECEEDEYRCANGQCIADVYWMDGWLESSRECMDYSDENRFYLGGGCLIELRSFDCDERLCPTSSWSCGDGQCIMSLQRFSYQTFQKNLQQCSTLRDCNFACETCQHEDLWTLENGLCWPFLKKEYSKLELATTVDDDLCVLNLKCELVGISEETKCNCILDEVCRFDYDDEDEFVKLCSHPIQYPPHGLYRPYLSTYYTYDNFFFETLMPSIYTVNGSIKCRGYQGVTLKEEIDLKLGTGNNFGNSTIFLPSITAFSSGFESVFCFNENTYQNKSNDAPKFDELCWSEKTRTLNTNKSYSFQNVCPTNPQCLSSYRINDGYDDCHHSIDERQYNYPESCTNIRKYRLQCSSSEQPTCLLSEFMGTMTDECFNFYDEYFFGSNVRIEGITCFKQNDNQCQLFRNYIEMTTKNLTKEGINLFMESLRDNSYSRAIPYQYYCDSFWDLSTTLDESPQYCQQWVCPKKQYQCPKTGQCIDPAWICDGRVIFVFDALANNILRIKRTDWS
ncbi:unnamed protein product [Rotaria sordida]|uniref:Uncharacterized protein n=1 Tax=Rotaria sordida TaxID=392033 RepID=A0A819HHU0_9BILA|nr:unnamed protein product [Rotaria sordida]